VPLTCLDLWQIHEVIYENDLDLIFVANGAAEALLEAKKQGKARFLGIAHWMRCRKSPTKSVLSRNSCASTGSYQISDAPHTGKTLDTLVLGTEYAKFVRV
jgi:aryl-alcohol dehydrogenase-like predicted oxidoreductase